MNRVRANAALSRRTRAYSVSAMDGLERITPVVLTFDEEPNLGRCLESLRWARRVVVVDSGSTDRTREIASAFANVDWFERPFDSHGRQWSHALHETRVATEYALALDADMSVTVELLRELDAALPSSPAGAIIPFEYRYDGRPLRGSVYPAQLRLMRLTEAVITQPGHTQVFSVRGEPVLRLRARLIHDDRKPFERWVTSQLGYSRDEAERIRGGIESRGPRDLIRRLGLSPAVVGAVAYARAGGPRGGRLAVRYALERGLFECMLAIRLLASSSPGESDAG